ncbi:MAG TPA: Glu/Leu/Phe/Val dehydrogenase [Blastocatellia bacterium]|nr:Glu/Leu/Phe/Val dehydrogenase [Blastocatellia bacterium]
MNKGTTASIFEMMIEMGHEQIMFCSEPASGYRGIIAVHSTVLGPAVGGTRFWNYGSEEEAVVDALRLSRGMTYKCAIADVPLGGGKSIIIGDNRTHDREWLFRAHGRFVDRLGGRYITAEDVGTSAADMEYIALETKHVGGLASEGAGDPSPWTALGVFRSIQAAAKYRWGSDDLRGKRVAIQGCGNVGYHLARELHAAGAQLYVADLDSERVRRTMTDFNASSISLDSIYSADVDVFAPCALGGVINDQTIPQLRAEIICGAANNQLLEARHGDLVEARGILYAPDYVANGGGVLSGGADLFGWPVERVRERVLGIYDTLLSVFETAKMEGLTTYKAADLLAERRLRQGIAQSSAR